MANGQEVALKLADVEERLRSAGCRWWDETHELFLLPPALLPKVPMWTQLTTITGEQLTVGKDEIDTDTRGGVTAFGIKREQFLDALSWFGV